MTDQQAQYDRKQARLYKFRVVLGRNLYFCSMDINDALVDKLAMLSRLHFNETEKAAVKIDLEKMIRFVDKLNELDTEGVEPLLHISKNINVLREDEVVQEYTREEALMNSPVKEEEFFKVPKVIKRSSE